MVKNILYIKSHWKEIVAGLMLLLAYVFFKNEQQELKIILPQLKEANKFWLLAGFLITLVYVFLQGGINRASFAAVNLKLSWKHAVSLFLKRNFISVFLPAGAISSLAYSPSAIRKLGFKQTDINQASGLFGFISLLTVAIVGIPIIVYETFYLSKFRDSWLGLVILILFLGGVYFIFDSLKKKGIIFRWTQKYFPSSLPFLENLISASIRKGPFWRATSYSMGVEFTGIFHVFIAMAAIGAKASLSIAAAAYIVAVLLMIISPFLRGLGAVEMSMVYVLSEFGYSAGEALSITILFRVFEFWLPLLAGLASFSWRGRKFFLRVVPVLLTFFLGVINVISAITPPIKNRVSLLRKYLPLDAIHASNILVLFFGLILLIISAYLIRGLKNAWRVTIVIIFFSLIGNITKALDYEEALLCFITLIILLSSASQYRLKSSPSKMRDGLVTAGMVFFGALTFGFVSFYFINPRHFGMDFTWQQSLLHTLKSFLLVEDSSIQPITRFGKEYIEIVRSLGFFTWIFLIFSFVRTDKNRMKFSGASRREQARHLVEIYGNSSLDYFKVYRDKSIFLSEITEGFISYKVSGNFAIVLEGPVCHEIARKELIREFQAHCHKMGLRPVFYRVSEDNLTLFSGSFKGKMLLGQEALIEVETFSLTGKDRKSLRNGLNNLEKNGFFTKLNSPPHNHNFIDKLRTISDDWLSFYEKEESIFSQGMFDENELKQQPIIIVENQEGEIQAFLNIIPDYAPGECTYDLIRKSSGALGASSDVLIVALVDFAKTTGKQYINLGMVPMAGINQQNSSPTEKLVKVAFEKFNRFQHYKGLRQFKEKYADTWENKYLIFENDFDLIQLPVALNNVMKPLYI